MRYWRPRLDGYTYLEVQSLGENGFTTQGLKSLADSLPRIEKLKRIDLSWGDEVNASKDVLLKGFEQNTSLTGGIIESFEPGVTGSRKFNSSKPATFSQPFGNAPALRWGFGHAFSKRYREDDTVSKAPPPSFTPFGT